MKKIALCFVTILVAISNIFVFQDSLSAAETGKDLSNTSVTTLENVRINSNYINHPGGTLSAQVKVNFYGSAIVDGALEGDYFYLSVDNSGYKFESIVDKEVYNEKGEIVALGTTVENNTKIKLTFTDKVNKKGFGTFVLNVLCTYPDSPLAPVDVQKENYPNYERNVSFSIGSNNGSIRHIVIDTPETVEIPDEPTGTGVSLIGAYGAINTNNWIAGSVTGMYRLNNGEYTANDISNPNPQGGAKFDSYKGRIYFTLSNDGSGELNYDDAPQILSNISIKRGTWVWNAAIDTWQLRDPVDITTELQAENAITILETDELGTVQIDIDFGDRTKANGEGFYIETLTTFKNPTDVNKEYTTEYGVSGPRVSSILQGIGSDAPFTSEYIRTKGTGSYVTVGSFTGYTGNDTLTITKADAASSEKRLDDAEFWIFRKVIDRGVNQTWWMPYAQLANNGDGTYSVDGLFFDQNQYIIIETKAPYGYEEVPNWQRNKDIPYAAGSFGEGGWYNLDKLEDAISVTKANADDTDVEVTLTNDIPAIMGRVIANYVLVDENGNTIATLSDPIITTNEAGKPYTTSQLSFVGYTFKEVDGETSGQYVGNTTIEVTYKYIATPKTGNLVVKYVDESGIELLPAISDSQHAGTSYTTEQKVITDYNFKEMAVTSAPTTGVYKVDETIEVVYVYTKKTGNLVVKYVDELGNTLAPNVTDSKPTGTAYITEKKVIPDYTFKEMGATSAPTAGVYKADETIEVVYVYTKKTGNLIVRYVDESGTELVPSITDSKPVGTTYATEQKEISDYNFKEMGTTSAPTTGIYKADETIEVIYVYTKKYGNLIVKYVDESGEELTTKITNSQPAGTAYETEQKEIPDYNFKEMGATSAPTTEVYKADETIEVIYVYTKKTGNLIVKYVDESGIELLPNITDSKPVGTTYITEQKEILDYNFKEMGTTSAPTTGAYKADETIEVVYVYIKKTGNLIVKYVDESGIELTERITDSQPVGTTYTTEQKEILDYNFKEMKTTSAPTTGTYRADETIEVVYVYTKKLGHLIVRYEDELEQELATSVTDTQPVGTVYETEQKDIKDYNFKEMKTTSEPTTGTYRADETIEVTYVYTKKYGNLIVKYEDEFGVELAPSILDSQLVGTPYETEQQEIVDYTFKEMKVTSEPTTGTYRADETIEVTYVYTKNQEKDVLPTTGDNSSQILGVFGSVLSILGLFIMLFIRKIRNIKMS